MKRAQSIRREFRREAGLRRAARRIGFRDGNGPPPAGCRFLSRCMVADSIFCATTRLSRATIPPDEYGMKVRANPRYEAFFAHLQETKRPFAKWEGVAFRATPLPHANAVKLLDGKGSFKTGGRWSAAGTFRAVLCRMRHKRRTFPPARKRQSRKAAPVLPTTTSPPAMCVRKCSSECACG